MNTKTMLLGDILIAEGLITSGQLQEALDFQRNLGNYRPLGRILVEKEFITEARLDLALQTYGKRLMLGELLVRMNLITPEQLRHALDQAKKLKVRLGQSLTRLGYITDEMIREALCSQLNISFVDLDQLNLDLGLARFINRNYARRHSILPIAQTGQTLTIAMDDPTQQTVLEELHRTLGLAVNVVTSTAGAMQRAFRRLYPEPEEAGKQALERLDVMTEEESETQPAGRSVDDARRADAIVRELLNLAIEKRATDIHLEMLASGLQIRLRTDGLLREIGDRQLWERGDANARQIVARIKVLGKLDIAERRRPQDGSFRVRVTQGGKHAHIDLRVSVIPGYYGESVVLRILDRSKLPRSVDQLGFSPVIALRLRQLLQRTMGILLITGPTGSGKSATLCAALTTLYRPEIRVVTAEDPIEYVYEEFSQSEVNERIGNTFATYLRAFLRHDPEVIMVGEIRDRETAEMAFRAAQTGHLLLSTLHTNTAISAVTRLLDLNVDPNLISSGVIGVLAQRLVRQICTECREECAPTPELLQEFFETSPEGLRYFRGRGCPACSFTGYWGRRPVGELWTPSQEDILLINKNAPPEELRASAEASTISMAYDAMQWLREGRTTFEELIRTLPYSAILDFRRVSTWESVPPVALEASTFGEARPIDRPAPPSPAAAVAREKPKIGPGGITPTRSATQHPPKPEQLHGRRLNPAGTAER